MLVQVVYQIQQNRKYCTIAGNFTGWQLPLKAWACLLPSAFIMQLQIQAAAAAQGIPSAQGLLISMGYEMIHAVICYTSAETR